MTFYFKITTHLCLIPNDKALLKMKITLHVADRVEFERRRIFLFVIGRVKKCYFTFLIFISEGIVGIQQPHLLTFKYNRGNMNNNSYNKNQKNHKRLWMIIFIIFFFK